MKQLQTVGRSNDLPRICLWNKALITCGFDFGQPIEIKVTKTLVVIKPVDEGKRVVSKVMNHGNELPVIDLKTTKVINLDSLFVIGDKVTVTFSKNRITIKQDNEL